MNSTNNVNYNTTVKSERVPKNLDSETRIPSIAIGALSGSIPKIDPNPYDQAFKDFPHNQMFRLFIDRKRQKEGEDTFDVGPKGEPGYKKGMQKGFSYIRETIGRKFDADELEKLHDQCVEGVFHSDQSPFKLGYHPGWKYRLNDNLAYNINSEWEKEKLISDKKPLPGYLSYLEDGYVTSTFKTEADKIKVKYNINRLFDEYYKEIEYAKSLVGNDEYDEYEIKEIKLEAIVRLCRALQIYHVFPDANLRTIAFALLTKLLIENGFSPAILDDPYIFAGHCVTSQMILFVEQGMKNFEECKEDSLRVSFSSKILDALSAIFNRVITGLSQVGTLNASIEPIHLALEGV